MVHPHGTVDSPGTVNAYLVGLRDMARFMEGRGAGGGAGGLSPGAAGRVLDAGRRLRESATRRMLASFEHRRGGGACSPGFARWPTGGISRPAGQLSAGPLTASRNGNGCTGSAGRWPMRRSPAPAGAESAARGQDPRTGEVDTRIISDGC